MKLDRMYRPEQGLLSIVTPTLNASKFLSDTLASVMQQTYPYIEHVVVDGGSTDGTVELTRRLAPSTVILLRPQTNQAEAINEGFRHSRGEFFSFLNADDVLQLHAAESGVAHLRSHAAAAMVFGNAIHIDENGRSLGPYPVGAADAIALANGCGICQPASFLRASAFATAGGLDTDLELTFDYDLWLRLALAGWSMIYINEDWAKSRMHRDNKTLSRRANGYQEAFRVLRRHVGYVPFSWVHAYAGYMLDKRDHFFDLPVGSPARSLVTLGVGLKENWRQPLRFAKDYLSAMTAFHTCA